MELMDWVRVLNATLALVALVMLAQDVCRRWRLQDRGATYLTLALGGLLFVVAEFSIEAIILDVQPAGPRLVIATAATIWVIIGLWFRRKDARAQNT